MDNISNVYITECDESFYIKPARIHYEQDSKEKTWDVMRTHDSVAIILFNVSRHVLIFVKQFRPAVYFADVNLEDSQEFIDTSKYPGRIGLTLELCAGIVDKTESLAEIARQEVLEECGYDVPLSCFQKVTSYRSGVGITGSRQTLYYVEVTDSMKVSQGGGNSLEGEYIEVIEMNVDKARIMIYDESIPKPPSLILALLWFFENKCPSKYIQKL